MVKMPSTLGERAVPRSQRGIANIDAGPAIGAQYEGARLIKSGFDDLASGLKDAENALYQRQLQDEERELKMLDVEFSKQRRLINTEFRKTQGEVTLAERAKLDAKYKQAQEQILKKAKSSRVKQAFGMLAAGKVEIDLEQQDVYTEQQRRIANKTASEAVMTEAYQKAAEDWNNPDALILHEKTIDQEVESQARADGILDPKVIQTNKEAARSQLYKSQIEAALAVDSYAAVDIFEKTKNKIDGDVRYDLLKKINDATLVDRAMDIANQAIAAYPDNVAKQREFANTITDPKLRNAARQEIEQLINQKRSDVEWFRGNKRWDFFIEDRAREEDERLKEETALAISQGYADSKLTIEQQMEKAKEITDAKLRAEVERNIANNDIMSNRVKAEKLEQAKADGWKFIEDGGDPAKLPAETKAALDGYTLAAMETRWKQKLSGEAPVTKWDKYEQYSSLSQDELRNVDLNIARTELADPEFGVIRTLVTNAKQFKNDPNNPISPIAIVSAKISELGLVGGSSEKGGRLKTMYMQEVDRAEKANGNRDLTTEELTDILNKIVDPIVVQDYGWFSRDTEEKPYEVEVPLDMQKQVRALYKELNLPSPTDRELVEAFSEVIPDDIWKTIEQSYKKAGIKNPTDAQIRYTYLKTRLKNQ